MLYLCLTLSVLGVYSLASVSGSARLLKKGKIIVRTLLFYAIQVCESVKKKTLYSLVVKVYYFIEKFTRSLLEVAWASR